MRSPRRLSKPTRIDRIRERRDTSSDPIGSWTRRPSDVTATAMRRRFGSLGMPTVRGVYGRNLCARNRCRWSALQKPFVPAQSSPADSDWGAAGHACRDARDASIRAGSNEVMPQSHRPRHRNLRVAVTKGLPSLYQGPSKRFRKDDRPFDVWPASTRRRTRGTMRQAHHRPRGRISAMTTQTARARNWPDGTGR